MYIAIVLTGDHISYMLKVAFLLKSSTCLLTSRSRQMQLGSDSSISDLSTSKKSQSKSSTVFFKSPNPFV